MRGSQFDFGDTPRRRTRSSLGARIRFGVRVLCYCVIAFFLIVHWPENWLEILIKFLEDLRWR